MNNTENEFHLVWFRFSLVRQIGSWFQLQLIPLVLLFPLIPIVSICDQQNSHNHPIRGATYDVVLTLGIRQHETQLNPERV